MKDKSLEEINLLKLIVFTLSFISICTALILFLLLPALKKYQQISLVEHSQLSILKTTQSNFDFSKDKITKLKNENPKSLEQFKQNFNIDHFNIFLQKYFQNIKIQENKPEKKEKYLKSLLNIQATINNPKNLYDFIDALKNYDNLIKLDYPLKLQAAEQGINIYLALKIYSS
ncbi:hypothetical protein N4T57_06185 [Campylobacter hepaticus]|uniref:Uncharacterized protein n=1 Tax=Campylobacter hepaticus TaxID=1813019 RepID=A0A6A7JT50_9BACT|nr:hypothetical protein [Campylobacter hepaticus]AXP08185.1 hypothetical protein A2J15_000200 [Campylobacter hepaticus]MCZ0772719.1 hypothetical protein [Campylobacter hepaticus]MCZ0774187.1 hypothetical protein [Campylobacter hepaticus]MCZ0775439.1 hypothetical protein [Campylobacter hepaticus]MPV54646.1 hypothetical protein [Campylobacter hepaticus]